MATPVREHPLARGKLAERANRFLGTAWDRGWLPRPEIDPQTFWRQAEKTYGCDAESGGRCAEDVADFRERLERLCAAIRSQAQLNPLGQAMAWGQLNRVVSNRLALGAAWNERPALAETPIAAPIIVIGHMRSGTTRIHKLLAADPAHSHTRYQDAYHPVPSRYGLNRIKAAFELKMLEAINPWMQSIHPMAAGEVEEELAWISAGLHHSIYESQWHIPAYSAWSEARDAAPIYREFARILRTDASRRGIADKPRILKVPAFAEDLDTLLGLFPGARLVIAERGRSDIHRSAVSLCANQMAVQSDTRSIVEIEALWRHKIALRDERMGAVLAGWNGPAVRLEFGALGRDWESEITRCYDTLGLDLAPRALAAMRALMADSKSGRHRDHSRQLKRFSKPA